MTLVFPVLHLFAKRELSFWETLASTLRAPPQHAVCFQVACHAPCTRIQNAAKHDMAPHFETCKLAKNSCCPGSLLPGRAALEACRAAWTLAKCSPDVRAATSAPSRLFHDNIGGAKSSQHAGSPSLILQAKLFNAGQQYLLLTCATPFNA